MLTGLALADRVVALTHDEVSVLIGLASAVLVAVIGAVGLGVAAWIKMSHDRKPNGHSRAEDANKTTRDMLDIVRADVADVKQMLVDERAERRRADDRQDRELELLRGAGADAMRHVARQVAAVQQEVKQ